MVGKNGQGKTTILEAIYYALSPTWKVKNWIDISDFQCIHENIEITIEFSDCIRFTSKAQSAFSIKKITCTINRRKQGSTSDFSDPFIFEYQFDEGDKKKDINGQFYEDNEKKNIDGQRYGQNNLPKEFTDELKVYYLSRNRESDTEQRFGSIFKELMDEFNWRVLNKLDKNVESQNNDGPDKNVESQNNDGPDKKLNKKLKKILAKYYEKATLYTEKLRKHQVPLIEYPEEAELKSEDLKSILNDVSKLKKEILTASFQGMYTMLQKVMMKSTDDPSDTTQAIESPEKEFESTKDVFKTIHEMFTAGTIDNIKSSSSKITNAITKLSEEFGKFDCNYRGKIKLELLDIHRPFKNAFLGINNGTTTTNLTKSGSGVALITSLLLLEAIRELQNKEKEQQHTILLIDEPEMHLHPQWQYKLMDRLSDAEYQVIYTTHSVTMIDIRYAENIYRVSHSSEKDKKSGESQNHDVKSKTKQEAAKSKNHDVKSKTKQEAAKNFKKMYGIISHENANSPRFWAWRQEYNEMFFADKVILVEGPDDSNTLRYLIIEEDNILNAYKNVFILPAKGKGKMCEIIPYLKALEIPLFVIYDSDGSGKNEEDNQKINKAIYKQDIDEDPKQDPLRKK